MNWTIDKDFYDVNLVGDDGNRFLIGNGYMGIRGTLEEDRKEDLVAVNLAGIFDQVGDGWREPLNAPNPFYVAILYEDRLLSLKGEEHTHQQTLDFKYGIRRRKTSFHVGDGKIISIEAERFASMDQVHLLGMTYKVTASHHMTITLVHGIDTDVWDIHGPHYKNVMVEHDTDCIIARGHVGDGHKVVVVGQQYGFDEACEYTSKTNEDGMVYNTIQLEADQPVTLKSLALVYHTNDDSDPVSLVNNHLSALNVEDYGKYLKQSQSRWDEIWDISAVEIDGDQAAQKAVNYSLYHLNCAAPRHADNLSIPARALSGQTYKGAVFWDTELFMLDYFLYTDPRVAKTLINYRISTLEGALEKAKAYGLEGAFYPWESQEGGFDACTDYNVTDVFTKRPVRTYFKDKQVHISSAVVYAMEHYMKVTGDETILKEGGAKVMIECAKFYWSLLIKKLSKTYYELHDVIGPDEYHERVNNNAYTNRMAKFTLDQAIAMIQTILDSGLDYQVDDSEEALVMWLRRFEDSSKNLKMQAVQENGLVEQFDGYFKLEDITPDVAKSRLVNDREYWGGSTGVASDTQVIKQADVIAMMGLFPEEYDKEVLKKNFYYYEPRTEHGSSLSACMYAGVACHIDAADEAYPFFMKSATAEIRGGGKQWAGLVYIGGTHPAAAGGAWKNIAYGFSGLKIEANKLKVDGTLPKHWNRLAYKVNFRGKLYQVTISKDKQSIQPISYN